MTAILLIGLVAHGASSPPNTPSHHRIRVDPWIALAIDANATSEADEDTIMTWAVEQNAILSEYIREQDVIPVALGAVFSCIDALKAYVMERSEELKAVHQATHGLCEFSLSVDLGNAVGAPVDLTDDPVDGRAFLRSRQSKRDTRVRLSSERQKFVNNILDIVRSSARDVVSVLRNKPQRLADLALLVPRREASELVALLSELGPRASELGLACRLVGPSPAFSFVRRGGDLDRCS